MSKDAPDPSNAPVPREARVAIVAARFNEEIVKALIDGCLARLAELGANPGLVEMHRVPGAFELPLAAKLLAETGRNREALQVASEALELGSELGDQHRVAALHTNMADLLHADGQGDAAMAHLKEAARRFASVDVGDAPRPEIWTLVEW